MKVSWLERRGFTGRYAAKIRFNGRLGRVPFIVAEALRRQDYQVVGLGVKDHVNPEFASLCDTYRELGIGRLGAAIRFFRRHNVKSATMVGKFHKVVLFRRFAWIRHFPDWECIRTFYPHWVSKSKDRRDDTLLGAVVDAYARHGIRFAPATDYVPELLVKPGNLADRQLTRGQQKDVNLPGTWPRKWGVWTLARQSWSRGRPCWPWKPSKDGPVYSPGGTTVSPGRVYGRQSGQATAGHAV